MEPILNIEGLTNAKLVGMGGIGHRFTLSISAVALAVIGFLVIKLAAFLILSGAISWQEIGSLLAATPAKAKMQKSSAVCGLSAVAGLMMLAAAYATAIQGTAWRRCSNRCTSKKARESRFCLISVAFLRLLLLSSHMSVYR